MANRKSLWLILVAVLVLAAFIIPYTLLTGIDAWYGSFLFWVIITAAVIAVNVLVSAGWRDEK